MSRTRAPLVLIVAVLLICAAMADNQNKPDTQQSGPAAPEMKAGPDYVIGPEDVLNVDVWNEKQMSGQVIVRPDGKISIPLINDVIAAGKTPTALAQDITTALKQYVEDPRVTVVVVAINSKRYYVLGEVGKPGAFPLLPNMTVLQALSAAGGPTEYASLSKIYVLRQENGAQVKRTFNYKQVIKGEKPEQNLLLKPGDTIVVP